MPEIKTSTTRPWAVTITSWFFIIYAVLSAIPKFFLIINPEVVTMAMEFSTASSNVGFIHVPFSFQLTHALVGVPIILISGIFMLKGRLWALVIFLLWMFGVLVLTLLVSGLSILLYAKLAVAGIVTVLLTRQTSLTYFSYDRGC